MAKYWSREWGMKTPSAFRIIAAIFIVMSLCFAFGPIASELGRIVAYGCCIVGIGLILVLFGSLRLVLDDQRPMGG